MPTCPFAELLKRRRVELSLTQHALATIAGCTTETIRAIELGRRRPSLRLALRLADALQLAAPEQERFVRLARSSHAGTMLRRAATGSAVVQRPLSAPPIVRTKLQPPRSRGDVLARPRLVRLVEDALAYARLILISAPAGAGKTTLLTSVLSSMPLQPVWVSLDADDNDLVRFLLLLTHAVSRAFGLSSSAAEQYLAGAGGLTSTSQARLARHVVHALINDLPDPLPAPCLLVLDDLHVIHEPAIYAALDELIAWLPAGAALAVATRTSPPLALSQLRAQRELCEIRLDELHFTLDEAAGLLNHQLGLQLSEDEVAALHRRTEGWPAGLMLLAASLERIRAPLERTHFLDRLVQAHSYLFEYLAEEVLNQQDPFVRMFLLETSILADLTPAACHALTGRQDASAVLAELYRRNLFLVTLDDAAPAVAPSSDPAGVWEPAYRYHELFRTFLQTRLRREAPEWWSTLQRRAAALETDPLRRMQHLLQGADWSGAAALIEEHGELLLAQGQLSTVEGWLSALPLELLEARPGLVYLRGVIAMAQRDLERGRQLFEQALAGLTGSDDIVLRATALAALASCRSMMADFAGACAAAEEARRLPLPLPYDLQLQLLANRAHQAMGRGLWQQTVAELDEALDMLEEQPDLRALTGLTTYFFGAYGVLPPNGPARLERLCRIIERSTTPAHVLLRATAAQYRAWLLLWRNQWAEARAVTEHALQLSAEAGGLCWVQIEAGSLLPVLATLQGDQVAANARFAELDAAISRPAAARGMQSWLTVYLFQLGRVRWLQGQLDAARAIYERMVLAANPQEWPGIGGLRDYLSALLLLSEGQTAPALRAARSALALQERYRFTEIYADARVLVAAVLLQLQRVDEALASFEPVLAQRAADGTHGALRWEGAQLVAPLLRLAVERGLNAALAAEVLAAFGEADPATSPPGSRYVPQTGETLTPREVEVLRMLASGASNTEIAARLIISPHTVKHHVSHVLGKLNVTTRTEASLRARDLGLV